MIDGCIAQSNPNVPAAGKVTLVVVPDVTSMIGSSGTAGIGSNGWSEKSPLHVTVWPALILMQLGENCTGDGVVANVIARGSLAAVWSLAANSVGPHPFTGVTDASGEVSGAASGAPVSTPASASSLASCAVEASASIVGDELLEHAPSKITVKSTAAPRRD